MKNKIIIVGAGLCGTLLALRLAQKGYSVVVYERRPDMRNSNVSAGRSINLALSDRGLNGLSLAGIENQVKSLVIPMTGRMIHTMSGDSNYIPYSGRQGEWINSISRGGLNILMLDEAVRTGKIKFAFNMECQKIDFENGLATFENCITKQITEDSGEVIFGTDGANSAVRNAMLSHSSKYRFDFSQKYLDTGYKELEIPPGEGDLYRIDKNALHIWPRNGFMMIALPNLNGSFTVTVFLPFEGKDSFESLKNNEKIVPFFREHFPSALDQMPDLIEDFKSNPTGSLGTIKCFPWQINSRFLLMGDAAHAVVPFYGQGMNASFEDVVVLDGLIDVYDGNWSKILPEYEQIRKKDTDAIADLAQDNFYEMRDGTADPVFMLKRKIELNLEQTYSEYYSKYSMVTFREDLPYSIAMEKGRKQDALLMEYAGQVKSIENVDYAHLIGKLKLI